MTLLGLIIIFSNTHFGIGVFHPREQLILLLPMLHRYKMTVKYFSVPVSQPSAQGARGTSHRGPGRGRAGAAGGADLGMLHLLRWSGQPLLPRGSVSGTRCISSLPLRLTFADVEKGNS